MLSMMGGLYRGIRTSFNNVKVCTQFSGFQVKGMCVVKLIMAKAFLVHGAVWNTADVVWWRIVPWPHFAPLSHHEMNTLL
ncbi:hypothetical protein FKM82_002596 [Ascaphus truei]